ncbi:hypothetical protein BKA65DRAFT_490401 [Rhexocercosporidium sp. MPI-PUGE-AT-0058]|nr:hypothetical protein BKA65DRAFT_490401 [Rhexocercosporidium sp. MPI-PUGE-AT-0058]
MSFPSSGQNEEQVIGQRPDFCRIVLIGENGSGKTALITRFIFNTFPPPSTTTPLLSRLRTQRLVYSHPCIIELVEAEPREESGSDGNGDVVKEVGFADVVVVCYSVCGLRWHPVHRDRKENTALQLPLEGVKRLGGLVRGVIQDSEGDGEGGVMMVLGCQRDREDLRIVSEEEGRELAREWGCEFAEVEVESGCEGVDAFIDTLVRGVRERRRRRADVERIGKEVSVTGKIVGTAAGILERILRR